MRKRQAGRAGVSLTRLVIDTYGGVCWLNLPGCTKVATTKDHVIPFSHGGDDSIDNLRPACKKCNSKRRNLSISGMGGVTVKVVIGPPAAGKTTYIETHAKPADVTIDLYAIARALMPIAPKTSHVYPPHVRHIAIGARKAAIERATRLTERVTVWIIHAIPTPDQLAEYRGMRYEIVTVDPGREVVDSRARIERPAFMHKQIGRWYDQAAALERAAQGPASPSPSPASRGTTNQRAEAVASVASSLESGRDW